MKKIYIYIKKKIISTLTATEGNMVIKWNDCCAQGNVDDNSDPECIQTSKTNDQLYKLGQ